MEIRREAPSTKSYTYDHILEEAFGTPGEWISIDARDIAGSSSERRQSALHQAARKLLVPIETRATLNRIYLRTKPLGEWPWPGEFQPEGYPPDTVKFGPIPTVILEKMKTREMIQHIASLGPGLGKKMEIKEEESEMDGVKMTTLYSWILMDDKNEGSDAPTDMCP
jgi:hypothetical protein